MCKGDAFPNSVGRDKKFVGEKADEIRNKIFRHGVPE
jgi:hypothetical protein